MSEIQFKDLSFKSRKSRFAPVIFAQAEALSKKNPKESFAALEAHARDRVAFGAYSRRLRKEGDTDILTGALSRKAIFRGISEAIAEAQRKDQYVQVLFMDVKGLKPFNDQFGHKTGDEALRLFVEGVKKHIRPYDEIGRYGGDEFLLLRKDVSFHAERLLEDINVFFHQLGSPYNRLSSVVGVANYSKDMKKVSAEELVHRADQAYYYAKEKHIDKPVTWDPSMVSIVVPK